MILDTVYIISYLNENEDKYDIRMKAMKKQAEWLSKINEVKEVNYFSQMWPKNLINEIKDIYFSSNKIINIQNSKEKVYTSVARNKNLKNFYESGKEIALFLDDDVIVETYDKLLNIFEYYNKYILNKVKFDVIGFKNCMYGNETKKRKIDSFLKPTVWQASSALIITKMKKEIYFNETLPALEDMEFGINVNYNKFKYYCCFNPYLKENTSISIMFTDSDNRKERNNNARKMILNKWNLILPGYFKMSNNKLLQNKFIKYFVNTNKEIIINFDKKDI